MQPVAGNACTSPKFLDYNQEHMLSPHAVILRAYNTVYKRLWPVSRPASSSPELKEIEDRVARCPSDISDHLSTIFSETVAVQPRLIVELGVRGGESRFAFERAARVTGSALLSVDIEDCSSVCGESAGWHFVQSDDIEFAQVFPNWCSQHGIEPRIDVLFIDTSHLFEHTLREIQQWFPYLSGRCKVLFHDTNPKRFYRRLDGTIGPGCNWKRAVVEALEEHLGARFNERLHFVTMVDGWLVRHWAHCNGLTLLERMRSSEKDIEDFAGSNSGAYTSSVATLE
jgi:cephalosporin hydroxylase